MFLPQNKLKKNPLFIGVNCSPCLNSHPSLEFHKLNSYFLVLKSWVSSDSPGRDGACRRRHLSLIQQEGGPHKTKIFFYHDLHCKHPPTPRVGYVSCWGKPSSCVGGFIPISFHVVSEMRRHPGTSSMTESCQQLRLLLLLGKYHLLARLATILQIFVLFCGKNNFILRLYICL